MPWKIQNCCRSFELDFSTYYMYLCVFASPFANKFLQLFPVSHRKCSEHSKVLKYIIKTLRTPILSANGNLFQHNFDSFSPINRPQNNTYFLTNFTSFFTNVSHPTLRLKLQPRVNETHRYSYCYRQSF